MRRATRNGGENVGKPGIGRAQDASSFSRASRFKVVVVPSTKAAVMVHFTDVFIGR
jgi:hypothetical protein